VAPTLEIRGTSRVVAEAAPNAGNAAVSYGRTVKLAARDSVYGPAAEADPTITCAAVSEGAPVDGVTATGGTFPYGVTAVTCTASDPAGNVGPAVTFTVRVDCPAGYSFQRGACRGAFGRGGGGVGRVGAAA
jgi:hypothetical protein